MNETIVDVSFYAEYPNFSVMAQKAKAVILRLGQGSWVDPVVTETIETSEGHLPRGGYWFYDGRTKPQDQVDTLLLALGDFELECPIFLDLERDYGGDYEGWINWHNFLRILSGERPDIPLGIYTRYYYFRDRVPTSAKEHFKPYQLWLARYASQVGEIPLPWTRDDLVGWQYTESGDPEEYGIDPAVKTAVDLNRYMGYDFNKFTSGFYADYQPEPLPAPTPEPVPEPAPEFPVRGRIASYDGSNIRSAPVVGDNKFAAAWTGKEVDFVEFAEENGNTWGKFEGWIAIEHDGNKLVELETAVPEPTPEPIPVNRRLWRVKHDQELPRGMWRDNDPEVMLLSSNPDRYVDDRPVKATEPIQNMMYELFSYGAASTFSESTRKKKFTQVFNDYRAFTNNNGFDVKRNYITGERLDYELPKFDKARVCGGATISGEVVGDMLKVETLREAVSLEYLLQNPHLYFEAIIANERPYPFEQGRDVYSGVNGVVYVPLISTYDVYYPLDKLEEVSEIANPYKV